jgi:hypothetical protein
VETLPLIGGRKHYSQQSDHANRGRVLTQHEESPRLGNLDAGKGDEAVRRVAAGVGITAGRYCRRQAVTDGSKEDHAWS